jgi:hypothetical protein
VKKIDKEVTMKLEELEKRVRKLRDIEEIKKLHENYILWLTNREWDNMAECFAENAIADIGTRGGKVGKQEIAKLFKDVMAPKATAGGGHMLINPVITVNGDKAKGSWALFHFSTKRGFSVSPSEKDEMTKFDFTSPEGQELKWIQSKSDCEYIRENGKWKFSSMKTKRPWPKQDTASPWPDKSG